MRAIFFGTPQIAVPALEALAAIAGVAAVVCQPDRAAGRGLELKMPAVKAKALELGLPVHQPVRVKTTEFASWCKSLDADIALVMAYGRLLPGAVLQAPRKGCVNLHASILPKYRGAAPINWAIARGELVTGVSLMQMDDGLDSGPVFCCHTTEIAPGDTAVTLAEKLSSIAAQVVRQELLRVAGGTLASTAQNLSEVTIAPMLRKNDGQIDWQQSALQVHNHIRAMVPWPGAFTHVHGKTLKIHSARVHSPGTAGAAGTVLIADPGKVVVACNPGAIELLAVQFEGRNVLDAGAVVAGRGLARGDVLRSPSPGGLCG